MASKSIPKQGGAGNRQSDSWAERPGAPAMSDQIDMEDLNTAIDQAVAFSKVIEGKVITAGIDELNAAFGGTDYFTGKDMPPLCQALRILLENIRGMSENDADKASARMSALAELIKQGKYEAGLLGQADLAPLEQALEAAAQRAEQLADQTKQAVDQFNDLTQSAQDAYDQEAGNQEDIEDRRHTKQLKDIEDAAKAAGKLNSDQYKQAVDYENKLHALKMRDLADEQNAQNGSGSNASGSTSTPSKSRATKSNPNAGGLGGGPTNQSGASLQPINIHINGVDQSNDQLYGTEPAARMLSEILRAKANSI